MYDYEIRDILRRATTPELWIDFNFDMGKLTNINFTTGSDVSEPIKLIANIGNKSQQPAKYAVINVFIDELFTLTHGAGLAPTNNVVNVRGRHLKVFSLNWGTVSKMPIFSEVMFILTDNPVQFTCNLQSLRSSEFYIGYQILTAGFSTQKYVRITCDQGARALSIGDEIDG